MKALEESKAMLEFHNQFRTAGGSKNKEIKPVVLHGKVIQGPSAVLIRLLMEIGASKAQIEQAARKMQDVFDKAGIKIDDDVENIEPMRKLEIKFHELYEQLNKVVNRSPEDYKNIQAILKDLKQMRDEKIT